MELNFIPTAHLPQRNCDATITHESLGRPRFNSYVARCTCGWQCGGWLLRVNAEYAVQQHEMGTPGWT